jgi:hypothetical protein
MSDLTPHDTPPRRRTRREFAIDLLAGIPILALIAGVIWLAYHVLG